MLIDDLAAWCKAGRPAIGTPAPGEHEAALLLLVAAVALGDRERESWPDLNVISRQARHERRKARNEPATTRPAGA